MSNFKLVAIPEDVEDRHPASIQVSDISGKWLCNILSTGYIVFNSEVDHEVKDVVEFCKFASMFYTLFNNIKNQTESIPIEIKKQIALEIVKSESEMSGLRKYTCSNGFGYSQFERNIVDGILNIGK